MFDAGKTIISDAYDIYATSMAIQSGVNPDAIRNLHMVEEEWAKGIATATQPVLLIADDSVETIGTRSSIIAGAMPNTPIIFESESGYKQAKKSRFLCAEFAHHMHGYCVNDDTGNDIDPVFKQSDMIVIIGQANSKISDIFSRHQKPHVTDYNGHGGAKINMPLIAEKTNDDTVIARQSWIRTCATMISRPCVV